MCEDARDDQTPHVRRFNFRDRENIKVHAFENCIWKG